jgi:hypothetical protein
VDGDGGSRGSRSAASAGTRHHGHAACHRPCPAIHSPLSGVRRGNRPWTRRGGHHRRPHQPAGIGDVRTPRSPAGHAWRPSADVGSGHGEVQRADRRQDHGAWCRPDPHRRARARPRRLVASGHGRRRGARPARARRATALLAGRRRTGERPGPCHRAYPPGAGLLRSCVRGDGGRHRHRRHRRDRVRLRQRRGRTAAGRWRVVGPIAGPGGVGYRSCSDRDRRVRGRGLRRRPPPAGAARRGTGRGRCDAVADHVGRVIRSTADWCGRRRARSGRRRRRRDTRATAGRSDRWTW